MSLCAGAGTQGFALDAWRKGLESLDEDFRAELSKAGWLDAEILACFLKPGSEQEDAAEALKELGITGPLAAEQLVLLCEGARREAERQARRESFGLGSLELPAEFICPITLHKMRDPVVASDGHSYERAALRDVLQRGNGKSPLTREKLEERTIVPNINLRKRIEEHEEEVLRAAAMAVAAERAAVADAAMPPTPPPRVALSLGSKRVASGSSDEAGFSSGSASKRGRW